jgi:hypothetical protein
MTEARRRAPPLESLLRYASDYAERLFAKKGELDMFCVCDGPGEPFFVMVPPLYVDNPLDAIDRKQKVAAALREAFAERGVVRYVHVAECWIAPMGVPADASPVETSRAYAALDFTLKNHPEHKEPVVFTASDGIQKLFAFRDIVRPAQHGGKPYLGKLHKKIGDVTSEWADLLSENNPQETGEEETGCQ